MGKIMLNGKQYGIGGITDADDIKYTDSQTVKGALDEVKNGLTALDELIHTVTYPTVLLKSSDNMNNVDCGTYYQSGGSMPSNAPSGGANNAYIIVVKARNVDRIQFWVSINAMNIQMRFTTDWNESTGTGTNWSAWAVV